MQRTQNPGLRSLLSYARVLIGHGWRAFVFCVATLYSIYSAIVPIDLQSRVLLAAHINPSYRLAIWGFGLATLFLYAGFRAWSESQSDLARLKELTDPHFEIEITGVSVEANAQPDWIRLYVQMLVRNQGAPSAIGRWTLRLRPPQPAGLSIHTQNGFLSELQIPPRGSRADAGLNLLHHRTVIEQGGEKAGWLLCCAPAAQLGLRVGQGPAVKVSFKDAYDHEFSAIYPPGFNSTDFGP